MKRQRTTSTATTTSTMRTATAAATTMNRPKRIRRSFLLCLLLLATLSKASRSFQPSLPTPTSSSHPNKHHPTKKQKHMSILNVSSAWGVGSSSSTYKQKQQQQNQQQQQQQNIVRDWASKILMNSQRQRQRQRFRTTTTTTVRPSSDCAKTIQYEQRKAEWANRYTNLDSLRDTFGSNINKVWGDLDAATARRLYKTLLPKALLELVKVGVQPEDLAPLAYQARVAAKLYARERCQVPARTAASLYDGFRQWKRYGKFQTTGMSYDQVWDKYHKVIMDEEEDNDGVDSYLTEEDVTAKICLKILERSCVSNEHVDRWVLPPEDQGEREDLQIIAQTLESDVRKLLDPMIACQTNNTQNGSTSAAQSQQNKKKIRLLQQYRILRLIARARRRARGRQQLALSR